jgi:hypothetical protein
MIVLEAHPLPSVSKREICDRVYPLSPLANAGERSVIGFISPPHKRTEERAPVWGSEFTCGTKPRRGPPVSFEVISPTHKRTEGRAPVWGSDYLSLLQKTPHYRE